MKDEKLTEEEWTEEMDELFNKYFGEGFSGVGPDVDLGEILDELTKNDPRVTEYPDELDLFKPMANKAGLHTADCLGDEEEPADVIAMLKKFFGEETKDRRRETEDPDGLYGRSPIEHEDVPLSDEEDLDRLIRDVLLSDEEDFDRLLRDLPLSDEEDPDRLLRDVPSPYEEDPDLFYEDVPSPYEEDPDWFLRDFLDSEELREKYRKMLDVYASTANEAEAEAALRKMVDEEIAASEGDREPCLCDYREEIKRTADLLGDPMLEMSKERFESLAEWLYLFRKWNGLISDEEK